MEGFAAFFSFLGGLVGTLGGLAGILRWLGIRPQHVKAWFVRAKVSEIPMSESPIRGKKWKLAAVLTLFTISLACSSLGFYLLARGPKQSIVGPAAAITFTQENFLPNDPRWTSGLRVTLATDKNRGPVQILIICDGDIGLAPNGGKSSKSGQFLVESQMLMTSHPEVWNVKWRDPVWTPHDTVSFEFLSRKEIHAQWIVPINYNPNVY